MNKNIEKLIIFGALLLDVIGIAVIIPAFPELKAYYGINDIQITMGLTVYSLFSFISAPLLGQLSDKYGRKNPLIRCVAGTAISYLILLLSQNYRFFIISRIINGITGGNISILQAVLTDISETPDEKNKNFGIMGAVFGMGFIIGPVLGALMLQIGGVHAIFWTGLIFSVIETLLIITKFYNTNMPHSEKHLVFNTLKVIVKYFKKKELRPLLTSLGLLGVGGFIVNSSQSLYMNNLFGTTGSQYGYYMAVAGVIGAINMGYLIRKVWLKHFATKTILIISHLALAIGYLLVGLMTQEHWFLGIFYMTILLGNTYMVIYNTEIMSHAKPNERGELSGMMSGLQSAFMFVWPLIWWLLLHYHINIFRATVVFTILSGVVMLRELRGR